MFITFIAWLLLQFFRFIFVSMTTKLFEKMQLSDVLKLLFYVNIYNYYILCK